MGNRSIRGFLYDLGNVSSESLLTLSTLSSSWTLLSILRSIIPTESCKVYFPFRVSTYLSKLLNVTPVHNNEERIMSGGLIYEPSTNVIVASVSNSSRMLLLKQCSNLFKILIIFPQLVRLFIVIPSFMSLDGLTVSRLTQKIASGQFVTTYTYTPTNIFTSKQEFIKPLQFFQNGTLAIN